MYRAIVCSEVDIVPSPAFFDKHNAWNYWYSRMRNSNGIIKGFMVYDSGEDDVQFYNMRAVLIQDCMKKLKLIGALSSEEIEMEIVNQLLDKEIVGLEEYEEYLTKQLRDINIY